MLSCQKINSGAHRQLYGSWWMGDVSESSVQWLCQGVMDYPHAVVFHEGSAAWCSVITSLQVLSLSGQLLPCSRVAPERHNYTVYKLSSMKHYWKPNCLPAAQSSHESPPNHCFFLSRNGWNTVPGSVKIWNHVHSMRNRYCKWMPCWMSGRFVLLLIIVLIISNFSSDGKKAFGLNCKVVLENWDIVFKLKRGLITFQRWKSILKVARVWNYVVDWCQSALNTTHPTVFTLFFQKHPNWVLLRKFNAHQHINKRCCSFTE